MSTTTLDPPRPRAASSGSFGERLIGPDDEALHEARALFNAMIDKRPALIARCKTGADVAAVIRFAREQGLPTRSAAGGHNWGGLASADDGVVIDLSPMNSVYGRSQERHGPRRRRLPCGREVDAATQPHALAVPTGIISTTGVAGLTLGGGHGYLTRRHGLTIDNLLSAEMVLADGTSGDGERRGQPRPLLGDPGRRRQLWRRHRVHVPGAPARDHRRGADVLGARGLGRAPCGVPGMAPFRSAQRVGLLQLAHDPAGGAVPGGDPPASRVRDRLVHRRLRRRGREGDRAVPLHRGAVDARGSGGCPSPGSTARSTGSITPGDQWYARADFVREIPDEAIQRNREWNAKMPTFKSGSHLYPVDGAVHDVAPEDTAFSFRDVTWSQVFIGVDGDPAQAQALKRLDDRVLGGAPSVCRRRGLRQLHDGRGPGTREGDLRRESRPPRAGEGAVRPGQRLPGQPKHPSGRIDHRSGPGTPAGPRALCDAVFLASGSPGAQRLAQGLPPRPARSPAAATGEMCDLRLTPLPET